MRFGVPLCLHLGLPQRFFIAFGPSEWCPYLEKLWFFHDQIKQKESKPDLNYLKEFEKKYKINLWKLAQNERIFLYFKEFHKFSSDEILNILEQECKFFEYVLEEIKPDYFFTRVSSLHHQELIYQMCKNTNVKVIGMNYTLLANKCMISQDNKKLDIINIPDSVQLENRNFDEIQNYLHTFDLVKQLENKLVKPGNSNLEKIRSMKEYLLKFDSENTNTHYTYYGRSKKKVFFYYLVDYIKTKIRDSFVHKNLKQSIKFEQPFGPTQQRRIGRRWFCSSRISPSSWPSSSRTSSLTARNTSGRRC